MQMEAGDMRCQMAIVVTVREIATELQNVLRHLQVTHMLSLFTSLGLLMFTSLGSMLEHQLTSK